MEPAMTLVKWLFSKAMTFGLVAITGSPFALAGEFYGFCETEPGHFGDPSLFQNLHDIAEPTEKIATAKASPFGLACQDPNLLKYRPKTGLFQRHIPRQDSNNRSTSDFLKRVGERVLRSMEAEELKLSVREDCLRKRLPKDDIGCRDTQSWLKDELTPLIKNARMNLALAQTVGQTSTLLNRSKANLNSRLDSLGTHKEVGWSRLTTSEVIKAEEILAQYKDEMHEATKNEVRSNRVLPRNAAQFENDGLLSARFTNGLAYVEILSRNPILQYLSSSSPMESEVTAAISKMRGHLKTDRASAEKALRNLQEPVGLKLLDYASHVEAELIENPADCGLAATLVEVKESRSLGNSLAIGIPLVVVSVGLPIAGQVMAGAVLGTTASVGYSVYSYYDMNAARERFISQIKTDDQTQYSRLKEADREFKISLAMGPLAMMIAPAARLVWVNVRAVRIGSKLSRDARLSNSHGSEKHPGSDRSP